MPSQYIVCYSTRCREAVLCCNDKLVCSWRLIIELCVPKMVNGAWKRADHMENMNEIERAYVFFYTRGNVIVPVNLAFLATTT